MTARAQPGPRLPDAREGRGRSTRRGEGDAKPKVTLRSAWRESKELIVRHRRRLAIGMVLMLVSRLAGLVLPGSSKYLIDHVIIGQQYQMLVPLALAAFGASVIQAGSGFALSQLLGVAAQRAVTDMRRQVEAHVLRLPVRHFDSTQTGILISRIMTDAEGIRNLVGSGLVQLVGGIVTAIIALGVLFWLNWQLTAGTLLFLGAFGWGMSFAFVKLRPIFRERSKINAAVTGRLTESLSGIRVVKAYVAERREDLTFARGVHKLFRNIATTITGVSALGNLTTVVVGGIGALMMIMGGRAVAAGTMTLGDLMMYVLFTG
ncbi:MAG TPA: ABC transporter ATP-binding protein, partial [Gemmatimonadales bacterium]